MMPRPEVAAIGTNYRRIPVMAIGKDIYNDTRLIIRKLEELFPEARQISATSADQKAIQQLLEHWAMDSGVFMRAAALIPSDSPTMQDSKFTKDRAELTGRTWSKEAVERGRPEAVFEIKRAFEFLENMLLADGRDWVLKTETPSLSDLEAVWPFHWLKSMPGALPSDQISAKQFPKVFSWIDRFDKVRREVAKEAGNPKPLKGPEAMKQISSDNFAEKEGDVDENDPSGLKKGDLIQVWPIDSGFSRKDRGKLISLSMQEIVVESKTESGQIVRVHAPRHGFRIAGLGSSVKL